MDKLSFAFPLVGRITPPLVQVRTRVVIGAPGGIMRSLIS
jgi:hypothetical protein